MVSCVGSKDNEEWIWITDEWGAVLEGFCAEVTDPGGRTDNMYGLMKAAHQCHKSKLFLRTKFEIPMSSGGAGQTTVSVLDDLPSTPIKTPSSTLVNVKTARQNE